MEAICILFLPWVGLYVSFLPLANARGKTSSHHGLPMVKTIYTYGFHELFLKRTPNIKNKSQVAKQHLNSPMCESTRVNCCHFILIHQCVLAHE